VTFALWTIGAYLAGSIPTSFLAGRLAGVDLRQQGSKNLGATNVYRVLGWKYAVPVGLVDVAKGTVPTLLAGRWAGNHEWIPLVVGTAAILGHVFSVFMQFRGGKGVATAAGVVLALAPGPLSVAAIVWIATLLASGYVSLASMLGAFVFPIAVRVLMPSSVYTFWTGVVLVAFILYTHRTNIGRLLSGTENRFGRRRAAGRDA
jgi:glycerol-3-phosphate acyltransferase PlsY